MSGTLLSRVFGKVADLKFGAKTPVSGPPSQIHLVVTPIGPHVGVQAYHSSILVDGLEYSFGPAGITVTEGLTSHRRFGRAAHETQILYMGLARHSEVAGLFESLRPFFLMNTYDLLRKNCNSFSDVALYFLLGCRLRRDFRVADCVGKACSGLVQVLGSYRPNPNADGWEVAQVLYELDQQRQCYYPRPAIA